MSIFRFWTISVGKTIDLLHNEFLASGDQKKIFHFVSIIFSDFLIILGKKIKYLGNIEQN